MDNPTGSFRLNDSITITGMAQGFAGNRISNGSVVFRVWRLTRLIYPLYSKGQRTTTYTGGEIAHGKVKADDMADSNSFLRQNQI
jgi:hypothetical protein